MKAKLTLAEKHSSEIYRQVYTACEQMLNFELGHGWKITILYDELNDEVYSSEPHANDIFPESIKLVDVGYWGNDSENDESDTDELAERAELSLLEFEQQKTSDMIDLTEVLIHEYVDSNEYLTSILNDNEIEYIKFNGGIWVNSIDFDYARTVIYNTAESDWEEDQKRCSDLADF